MNSSESYAVSVKKETTKSLLNNRHKVCETIKPSIQNNSTNKPSIVNRDKIIKNKTRLKTGKKKSRVYFGYYLKGQTIDESTKIKSLHKIIPEIKCYLISHDAIRKIRANRRISRDFASDTCELLFLIPRCILIETLVFWRERNITQELFTRIMGIFMTLETRTPINKDPEKDFAIGVFYSTANPLELLMLYGNKDLDGFIYLNTSLYRMHGSILILNYFKKKKILRNSNKTISELAYYFGRYTRRGTYYWHGLLKSLIPEIYEMKQYLTSSEGLQLENLINYVLESSWTKIKNKQLKRTKKTPYAEMKYNIEVKEDTTDTKTLENSIQGTSIQTPADVESGMNEYIITNTQLIQTQNDEKDWAKSNHDKLQDTKQLEEELKTQECVEKFTTLEKNEQELDDSWQDLNDLYPDISYLEAVSRAKSLAYEEDGSNQIKTLLQLIRNESLEYDHIHCSWHTTKYFPSIIVEILPSMDGTDILRELSILLLACDSEKTLKKNILISLNDDTAVRACDVESALKRYDRAGNYRGTKKWTVEESIVNMLTDLEKRQKALEEEIEAKFLGKLFQKEASTRQPHNLESYQKLQ